MDTGKLQHMARKDMLPRRFILCPIFESKAYLCDRKVEYFIAGNGLCAVHAQRIGLTLDQVVAKIEEAQVPSQYWRGDLPTVTRLDNIEEAKLKEVQ